jgi:hypothetical protein
MQISGLDRIAPFSVLTDQVTFVTRPEDGGLISTRYRRSGEVLIMGNDGLLTASLFILPFTNCTYKRTVRTMAIDRDLDGS